eukprot:UN05458
MTYWSKSCSNRSGWGYQSHQPRPILTRTGEDIDHFENGLQPT